MQPNFQEPVVQQANLAAEYEVAKDWSVMLGGLMVKGNHLQRTRDVNLGTPAPIGIPIAGTGQVTTINRYPSARPIAAFSRILQFESSANSLYDGLILQLRKRFSHNFELMTSYTWSHVIDDAPDATAVVPGTDDSKMPFDPRCPACDRASSVNDQRHRFVLSGIWQLQYGNGMSRVPKAILGGWEISTILSAQTGQPYTGLVNSDLNNDGNRSTDRAGQGRNTFNLPATWSLDPRLTKNVNFAEKVKMQLLVEAFNLFNHFNVYGVRTTQYSLIGGQLVPQTAGLNAFQLPVNAPSGSVPAINLNGARVFQLGAKVSF